MLRHFNALYIYILMFHPTSLDPVEVIMTMIRAIKIDHDTNPECSLFGIHIRHMTNDSNLGVYICIFGLSLKLMIIFLVLVAVIWQLCILRHIFWNSRMFRTYGLNWCMMYLF